MYFKTYLSWNKGYSFKFLILKTEREHERYNIKMASTDALALFVVGQTIGVAKLNKCFSISPVVV